MATDLTIKTIKLYGYQIELLRGIVDEDQLRLCDPSDGSCRCTAELHYAFEERELLLEILERALQ